MVPAAALLLRDDGTSERSAVAVEPAEALLDAPIRIRVVGARAGEPVRLDLSAASADGVEWTGSRVVRADGSGAVSVDGGGLLSSLHPTGVTDTAKEGLVPPDDILELHVEARQGGRALGTAIVTRSIAGPAVSAVELTVAHDGLAARYWTGSDEARRPVAVLSLGGSGGGQTGDGLAALLASHGYPVLQLAYFREKGLPGELRAIPLEYFERALRWLGAQRGVDPGRVVVLGRSRGAELAILLGATYPKRVAGVVAYAPSYVVVPGSWTVGGKPLPSPSSSDPRIPVERIRGPVLLVAGGADQVSGSAYAASAIAERRKQHGRPETEAIVRDDAGHGVTAVVPYLPLATEFPVGTVTLVSGGTRRADSMARTAAWPRLLALLERVARGGD
jgi:dienelactone hydrolase